MTDERPYGTGKYRMVCGCGTVLLRHTNPGRLRGRIESVDEHLSECMWAQATRWELDDTETPYFNSEDDCWYDAVVSGRSIWTFTPVKGSFEPIRLPVTFSEEGDGGYR